MGMDKKYYVTASGYEQLKIDLETLKSQGRKDVAEKIKIARSYGDLSENAEYDEAKKEQAFVEGEIIRLEKMVKEAIIIDENAEDNKVSMGHIVTVYDYEMEEEFEVQLVGYTDVDPSQNKISHESPIGSALLGKSAGEDTVASTPDGDLKLKVVSFHR
ncbi:MAG: transcription elongation factor GreA [Clostridiales bacterium]|nr:transcription elongation factor GreA [Clostridiales bacterium]